MRKALGFITAFALVLFLFPAAGRAASASFSISGPATLGQGETATYTVQVTVKDAAAAQATLVIDTAYFRLVSGNLMGVWDVSANTDTTATLTTVTLECIAAPGSSGVLSLKDCKVSRFTGAVPPAEAVSWSGASKTVANPIVTPSPKPTPTPKPPPTPKPAPRTRATPTATPVPSPTATATPGPVAAATPAATAEPSPWQAVEGDVLALGPGQTLRVTLEGEPVVPAAVLRALGQTGGVLELTLPGYTCTIRGEDLAQIPPGVAAFNLALGLQKDGALSALWGGSDACQLHPACRGRWPGPVFYTIPAQGHNPGELLNLYCYYDDAGVTEWKQAAMVDGGGGVTFALYHGGAYFVTGGVFANAVNNPVVEFAVAPVPAGAAPPAVPVVVLAVLAALPVLMVGSAAGVYWFRFRKRN